MASKKVNGLTIAVNADTKGVTEGLKDITSESVKLSNNLKAVDSLLKLDPGNTELLAERQKLLAQNVETTSKKLQMLKDAQEDVNRAFKNGEISDAQYIAFQKEIVNTQKHLDDMKKSVNDADKEASKFAETLKSGLVAGAKVAATAVTAVGTAAAAAVTGVVKLASETASLGDDIDKNSQKLGMSAEAYQEWDFILQHSGSSADALQGVVKKLSSQMKNAQNVIAGTAIADEELEAQLSSGEITAEEYANAYDKLYEEAYKSIDAFSALGYSMSEIENLGGTEEVLADVISRLQQMPEGFERTAIATSILGKNANELGALLNTSAEDTEAMRQQVHDLGGVMSDEAVKDSAAFQDALQNLNVSIDGVKNGIAANFLPSLTTMMDGISGLVSGSGDGIDTFVDGLNGFVDSVHTTVENVKERFSDIVPAISDAITSNLSVVLGLGVDIIMELLNGITNALPTVANTALDIVNQILTGILKMLPDILKAGVDVIVQLVKGISMMLPELIPLAVEVVTELVKGIADSIPQIVEAAMMLIQGLDEGILEAIPVLLEALPPVIDALVNGLLSSLPTIIQTGVRIFTALVEALPEIIDTIVTVLPQIMTSIISAIMANLPQIMDAGFDLFTALVDNLPGIIAQVVTAIPLIVAALWQAVSGMFPQMADYGMQLFTQLIERGEEIREKIKGLIPKIITSIADAFMDKYNDLQTMGMDIFDNVSHGIQSVLSNAWSWGSDLISNFVNGITENISKVISAATNIGQTIKDYIGFSEPDKGPLSDFHTFAPDMMQLFADGIKDNTDVVANQFNRSLSGITADATMGLSAGGVPGLSGVSSAPMQLNVNVTVGSIASDYDVNRMTDHMIENISAELANLRSRQSALVGVM